MNLRKIDLVSYINLDFRKDRQQHMEETLRYCPFPVTRVSAVRLTTSPSSAGIVMKPGMESAAGVASIFLSHKLALKSALEKGVENGFILLEDDVRIKPDLWGGDLISKIPSDPYDISFLSPRLKSRSSLNFFSSKAEKDKILNLSGLIKQYSITGAHFLIFKNRTAIEKTLAAMDACKEIFDVDVFYIRNIQCCGYFTEKVGVATLGSDHKIKEIE